MLDTALATYPAPAVWDEMVAGGLNCQFRSDVGPALVATYARHSWVYDALLAEPSAELLRGRRPVVSGWLGHLGVVVKRMHHGGVLARISRDGFLSSARVRAHVPLAEILVEQGVATAPVVFASWRRIRGLVRGEVGFERIQGAIDADRFFFDPLRPPAEWDRRAGDLGALVARLHQIGFLHADLNLMNFLFGGDGKTYILDLDNSVPACPVFPKWRWKRNLDRLERSIRKQGRHHRSAFVEAIVQKVRSTYTRAFILAGGITLPELLSWATGAAEALLQA